MIRLSSFVRITFVASLVAAPLACASSVFPPQTTTEPAVVGDAASPHAGDVRDGGPASASRAVDGGSAMAHVDGGPATDIQTPGAQESVLPGAEDGGSASCANANSTAVPIDSTGVVVAACNAAGIQGKWYCGNDTYGTRQCPSDGPPYSASSPGPGMCIGGTTSTNTSGAGAWIGLQLDGGATAYDAQAERVVGFAITIAGDTGQSSLRIEFTGSPDESTSPFVAVPGPGTYDVYFADAQVPGGWSVSNAGAAVDPTSIYDVRVLIPNEAPAVSYDYCVTSLVPLTSRPAASTSCSAPSASGPAFCDATDVVFPVGDYGLQNDVWNPAATGTQCMQATLGGSCAGFAVSGSVDSHGDSPASYPSLIYGWASGSFYGAYKTARTLGSIGSVPSQWTYSVGSGEYDVAYDIWFAGTPAPKDGTGGVELMIWPDFSGATPAGAKVAGPVTVDGTTWNVYYTSQLGATANWAYLAYQTTSPGGGGTFNHDLKTFFADAIDRGYLPKGDYLLGVQAGFEIWSGGAGLATTSFQVAAE